MRTRLACGDAERSARRPPPPRRRSNARRRRRPRSRTRYCCRGKRSTCRPKRGRGSTGALVFLGTRPEAMMGKAVMMQALLQGGGSGRRATDSDQTSRRGRGNTTWKSTGRGGRANIMYGGESTRPHRHRSSGGGYGGGFRRRTAKTAHPPPSDNVNHEATRGKNWRVRGHPIPEDPHESDTYMSRYRAGQARTALGHRAPRAEREARSGPCASVSGPGAGAVLGAVLGALHHGAELED